MQLQTILTIDKKRQVSPPSLFMVSDKSGDAAFYFDIILLCLLNFNIYLSNTQAIKIVYRFRQPINLDAANILNYLQSLV